MQHVPNLLAMTRRPHSSGIMETAGVAVQLTTKSWSRGWRAWATLNDNELAWIGLVTGVIVFTDFFANR